MSIPLNEFMATLAPEEQVAIKAGAAARIKSYKKLLEFRKELGMTQGDVASRMRVTQESVSRLERRKDMHISTLKRYIEALGGELEIHVNFPATSAEQVIDGHLELA